ncbi:MAG: hypothetical protein Q4A31_06800 [Corynebacterium sp.]|uniref:hypothetical protein n=1 Tax=Corynebacterium sp. TaxID=1720 RepID=UPI0026DBAF7A|nr:hypothetical protein [Corynebacterium sp.]MDO4761607.1 hypothetical protein [Corynebacterium sp.]
MNNPFLNTEPTPNTEAETTTTNELVATTPATAPAVVKPTSRRRPRFVERPTDENTPIVNRRDLLTANKTHNGKPQISRERQIAGNLPNWEPTPPGGITINRH